MLIIIPVFGWCQEYTDFLGAGHTKGVTVTTSHNQTVNNNGGVTIDGFQSHSIQSLKDASRFLAQATMGYDYETIEAVASMGYDTWIDEQFSLGMHLLSDLTSLIEPEDEENEEEGLYGRNTFRAAWLSRNLNYPDLLRQKVAWALSQIFVVSGVGSDLYEDITTVNSGYYDILVSNAFANYRDLLRSVSLSPSMGIYLSHINNPKADPANNIHPDENYAREVMQLFSLGLYELNLDGTAKLDNQGNPIPTYDNDDIREFAKIFTGFGNPGGEMIFGVFGFDEAGEYGHLPMKMYEEWHQQGTKSLLNGQVVPSGQSGMKDFEDAIDNLYNHPNVGPFIGKALIQFLVTSNPSPSYVERVASAFNDNGLGERGDMKAVVKAILLDPEARICNPESNPSGGKLREPLMRYMQLLKAFNAGPVDKNRSLFKSDLEVWSETVGQVPMFSPSVFNFYLPDFQPNGPIAQANLVGPEFQIHNSSTAIGYINQAYEWLYHEAPLETLDAETNEGRTVMLDLDQEYSLASDPTQLIDRLDIALAAGQLTQKTKDIIVSALRQTEELEDRVNLGIYLVLISPDFAILK